MKIFASKFKTVPLDIENNFIKAKKEIEKAIEKKSNVIVFPKGFLTGTQLGLLEDAVYIRRLYNDYIEEIITEFEDSDICILLDRLTRNGFENTFIYKGDEKDEIEIAGFRLTSFNSLHIFSKAAYTFKDDYDLIILNATEPTFAGKNKILYDNLKTISHNMNIPIFVNMGGYGYTTHPEVSLPLVGLFTKNIEYLTRDIMEYINADSLFNVPFPENENVFVNFVLKPYVFKVEYNECPLIPKELDEKEYLFDLFNLAAYSLATRLDNIGLKKVVLNLSGGLDSTMALLIAYRAFCILNLDKSGIIVLTMPAMGTSNTTKTLAKTLSKELNLDIKTIDITAACTQALLDIGHDAKTPDVTFENTQARMRTLNGLNYANKENAIMIGTGDLSEEALGFATYGGDHLASYNVNSSISKTVIRKMLKELIKTNEFQNIKNTVNSILENPVSPELLPITNEEFTQKTEEILAPYKLIDFFIYSTVVAKISKKEIINKALSVFLEEFSKEYIEEKLNMFYKKLIAGQFKRSCAPEGAILTHCHLNGEKRSVPSDAKTAIFK